MVQAPSVQYAQLTFEARPLSAPSQCSVRRIQACFRLTACSGGYAAAITATIHTCDLGCVTPVRVGSETDLLNAKVGDWPLASPSTESSLSFVNVASEP